MRRSKDWFLIIFGVVFTLAFCWSFFRPGFFLFHDFTHVARLVELERALQAGQFPAHWAQNFGFGYGMPLFLFYGPLPFYLAALLHAVGLTAIGAIKGVFVMASVTTWLGAYFLMRRWGRTAGLVAGTLLVAAPYRAVDMYIRGALNETWGIAFLPWILHGFLTIRTHPRQGFIVSSLALSGLLLTHNLTVIMSLPIFLFIAFFWNMNDFRHDWRVWWQRTSLLFASVATAFLLTIGYWLPSFFEKGATIVETLASGYFDYHLHFLYLRQFLFGTWGYGGSEYGPNDGISFQLGLPIIVLALITGALVIRHGLKQQTVPKMAMVMIQHIKIRFVILSFIALGISLFLSTGRSVWVWEHIPFLSYVQFPWRFQAVSIVLLAALGSLSLSAFRLIWRRWVSAFLVVLVIVAAWGRFHQPQTFMPDADRRNFSSDPTEIRGNLSSILIDYLPPTFNQSLPPIPPEKRIMLSSGNVRWETNTPQELLAIPLQPTGGTVTWNIAHFPGWQYYLNGQEVAPTLTKDGVMTLAAPAGLESIGARFTLTPIRQWSLIASGLALIGYTAAFFPWRKERKTGHGKKN